MSGGGGNILSAVAPLAISAMFPALAPAIGTGLGASSAMAPMIGSAILGAGTGALTSGLTGGNPLQGALFGGASGGLGAWVPGGGGEAASAAANPGISTALDSAFSANPAAFGVGAAQAPLSLAGKLGNFVKEDPLKAATMGAVGLSALSSLMPQPEMDIEGNRARVLHNSGFDDKLPEYKMVDTATPYEGDWYKYGESPEKLMYNPKFVPQMAKGGKVRKSPLDALFADDGQVRGHGKGQDDSVPARLSQDEYVIPADVVAHLGDGSSNAGGTALDGLVSHVRKHKATKKFPPKSKSPLSYLSKKGVA